MGKCMFMRKGSVHSEPSNIKANFADNTWEQIIEACQSGTVPETWEVGDQKAMTINGTDYAIDIIGKNHDTYSDGSGAAPLTFQMHGCYNMSGYKMQGQDNNTGGWENCIMRTTALPSLMKQMPSEVQAAIREVNKKTSAGNLSSTINTTADKLFLLSEIEVFARVPYSINGEGSQYAYYAAGNSAIKTTPNNTARNWWVRSPYKNSRAYWCMVYSDGNPSYNAASATDTYVAFAFCF